VQTTRQKPKRKKSFVHNEICRKTWFINQPSDYVDKANHTADEHKQSTEGC
jgi:hypothetical protein